LTTEVTEVHRGVRAVAQSDAWVYTLGAGLGIGAGVLDVEIGDLLLTALFVLASTMLLGAVRPAKPWRWTLSVAVFVPIVQLAAYFFLTEKPYRAQIYESFLGFLTGIAGAYGGAVGRGVVGELWK
jgi:hypothetical protein